MVSTTDGIHYAHVQTLELPNQPNESTIRFDTNGRMLIVVRNQDKRGHLGISESPFLDWEWKQIPKQLGGPGLIQLPGGDTSYPGLLVVDEELWVSYYSSHEGKSSIYLAKIGLDQLARKTAETGSDK